MKIRMSFKQMVGWLTLSWATAASSGTFVVDDFTAFPTTISFTNAAVVGDILTHTDAQRTITSELLQFVLPIQSAVNLGAGQLNVANGGGERSRVTLTWNVPAGTVPAGATDGKLRLPFILSDGGLFRLFLCGMHDDFHEVTVGKHLLGHGLYVGVGQRLEHLFVIGQVVEP